MKKIVILSLLLALFSCKSNPVVQNKNLQDGYILLGFNLVAMTNKGNPTNKLEQILSITLKNVDSGERYVADLSKKNFVLRKVKPGNYCIDKITTYKNFSIQTCNHWRIPVSSGQVKNAGYWIAGISYDSSKDRTRIKFFDRYTGMLTLLEETFKFYGDKLDEKFQLNREVNPAELMNGYWYTAMSLASTIKFDISGKYYKINNQDRNANAFSYSGKWSANKNLGKAELNNRYGSSKLWLDGDKLYINYENKVGYGYRLYAHRNPFRLWGYEPEFNIDLVDYNKSSLESIAKLNQNSVFIKMKFDTVEQNNKTRVGKIRTTTPVNVSILSSNINKKDEDGFLDKFKSWRFGSPKTEQEMTVCMIVNEQFPDNCSLTRESSLIFKFGERFVFSDKNLIQ